MKPKRLTACLLLPMLAVVGRCEGLQPDLCTLDDYSTSELAEELGGRAGAGLTSGVQDWLDGLLGDDE